MINSAVIKENYSKMTDEQLIHLAEIDGKDLTDDALNILYEEFQSRRLGTSVFETLAENKIAQRKREIESAQDRASSEFVNSIWSYAFDEKEAGKTNEEIHKGLLERGLDEEHSSLIITSLESKAKEILEAHDSDMLVGGLICAGGILITFWTLSSALSGGTYIVAWGAIIFGAIRFFKGVSNKNKYKTILANIQSETNVEEVTKS